MLENKSIYHNVRESSKHTNTNVNRGEKSVPLKICTWFGSASFRGDLLSNVGGFIWFIHSLLSLVIDSLGQSYVLPCFVLGQSYEYHSSVILMDMHKSDRYLDKKHQVNRIHNSCFVPYIVICMYQSLRRQTVKWSNIIYMQHCTVLKHFITIYQQLNRKDTVEYIWQ